MNSCSFDNLIWFSQPFVKGCKTWTWTKICQKLRKCFAFYIISIPSHFVEFRRPQLVGDQLLPARTHPLLPLQDLAHIATGGNLLSSYREYSGGFASHIKPYGTFCDHCGTCHIYGNFFCSHCIIFRVVYLKLQAICHLLWPLQDLSHFVTIGW